MKLIQVSNFSKIFCFITCFCLLNLSHSANYAEKPLGYAVASANPLATSAGLEILALGGNAFDAAVAVSAALAVVEPYHSGLGGGGFWLLHQAKTNKNIFIDGRETAPLAAKEDMFLDESGNPKSGLSLNGGLAAAIPGEPAALALIANRFGRLPLSQTLAPAIRLAEFGFPVDEHFNHFVMMEDRLSQMQRYKATAAIFLKDGKPYKIGDLLIQRDLANTLRVIAKLGHDGFYRNAVAKRLVDSVNKAGGNWTEKDLALYQVKIREPLVSNFHDVKIITAPLPSAGGVGLVTMLNILTDYPLRSLSKVLRVHYLVEAMRLSYWQRSNLLADPDFVKVPLKQLLSLENTKYLRSLIKPRHATPSDSLPSKSSNNKTSSTTHFSIIDSDGNRVAATLSINYIFGSSVVADGTGVLLNDEMDDFTVKVKEKNVFGLVGGEKNLIAPAKRPLSSMTPTFLEMPGRVAILGTPGGSRIPTMVLIASLLFSEDYGAISMVSAMRFHHQYLPDWLQFEPDTFSVEEQKELQNLGYKLAPLQAYYGDMQAITWDKEQNLITAASDPRNIGRATKVIERQGGYGLMH